MHNKKLRKIYAGCALAMALTMATGPLSAFATDVTDPTPAPNQKTGGEQKSIDPVNGNYKDGETTKTYTGTAIDVWGFSETTKYSVDVEWGAMTFKYEATWNPGSHKMDEGGEWKIYDSEAGTLVTPYPENNEHAINKITITNHSNAAVKATLSYAAEAAYTNTKGTFTNSTKTDPAEKNVKATWTDTDDTNHSTGYFTLQTASTDADGNPITDASTAGTPSKGSAYFMPSGISNTNATSGITKWTKIGTITVAIDDLTTP